MYIWKQQTKRQQNILTRMYKRDLTVFFTRTAKKLEAVIHKMTNASVMITFEDIEIIPNYSSSMVNLASIRSVKNEINEIKIEIDNNRTAYSTEIGGQLDGTIVSAINKNDLQFILDKNTVENIKFGDLVLEFFNIVNTNVMSQLADSMNVQLDAFPVREYIKDKDSIVKNKDLTSIKFNIEIENKIITLDVYLWLNMSHLYKHLF